MRVIDCGDWFVLKLVADGPYNDVVLRWLRNVPWTDRRESTTFRQTWAVASGWLPAFQILIKDLSGSAPAVES